MSAGRRAVTSLLIFYLSQENHHTDLQSDDTVYSPRGHRQVFNMQDFPHSVQYRPHSIMRRENQHKYFYPLFPCPLLHWCNCVYLIYYLQDERILKLRKKIIKKLLYIFIMLQNAHALNVRFYFILRWAFFEDWFITLKQFHFKSYLF